MPQGVLISMQYLMERKLDTSVSYSFQGRRAPGAIILYYILFCEDFKYTAVLRFLLIFRVQT